MWKSFAYLFLDVGIVAGLAIAAFTINQWWVLVDEHAAHTMACGEACMSAWFCQQLTVCAVTVSQCHLLLALCF